ETFYYPASTSLISDYHGRATRSRALGIHQTSVYVGTIAGSFFAGLIGQVLGWRWSFVVFGGCGIALGLVLRRFLVAPRRGAAESTQPAQPAVKLSPAETLSTVLRTPTVLVLMAAFACANFVAMVLLSWMPDYVHRQFGLDLALSGLTATMYAQLA